MKVQRSLSYNDLKKRRCLRLSKSKQKLKKSLGVSTAVQTQKKKESYLNMMNYESLELCFASQKNEIDMIKKSLFSERVPKSQLQQYKQWKSKTDRKQPKKAIEIKLQKSSSKQFVDNVFDSKQIVRTLIERQKSTKRVFTWGELRNKVKEQKQRSRSLSRNKGDSATNPKISLERKIKDSRNQLRIKKFEKVQQQVANKKHSKSKRKLVQIKQQQIIVPSNNIESVRLEEEQKSIKNAKVKVNQNILHLLEAQNDKDLRQAIQQEQNTKKKRKKLQKFKNFLPKQLLEMS